MTNEELSTLWKLANEARAEEGKREILWGDVKAFVEAFKEAACDFEPVVPEPAKG